MKKLMIAAAVALAAVASQAASVTWTCANPYVDGWNNDTGKYTPSYYPGTALDGLMVYVFDANATDMSQAYIYDQVINQGKSLSQLTSVDNAATGSDGKFPTTANVICDTENWTGKIRTSGTKSYIDLIAAATWTDEAGNEYLYLSSTMSAQVQSSKDTALSDSNTANTRKFYADATAYSSPGWYSVVPEPTSGLLLLLGVAGLALRRRRA